MGHELLIFCLGLAGLMYGAHIRFWPTLLISAVTRLLNGPAARGEATQLHTFQARAWKLRMLVGVLNLAIFFL